MSQAATNDETIMQDPAVRARRRRPRWVVPVVIVLAAGGCVLWDGCRGTGTGPAMGTELSGPAPTGEHGRELRIGTFNIHGGIGQSGVRDLDLTANCLRDLDLAGVNEVHGLSLTERRGQAELLGEKLGVAWLFAPTETRWWQPNFGNAALTRLPITYWERLPLPHTRGRGFRNMTLLMVPFDGKTLHVLITHVDRGQDRPMQLRAVCELFLALAEPAVLMGDLNTDADDPQIRSLLASPGVVDAVGQVLGEKAPRRIDWIFARGLKCLDAGLVDRKASDHPMAWARLEIGP
jgi:endonuclease/exonuclease/phosphatase family metal-dependent hydrolase